MKRMPHLWGYDPPLLPYKKRRDYILGFIGARSYGLIRPTQNTYWGGSMIMRISDINRMIKEGDLIVKREKRGGHIARTILYVAVPIQQEVKRVAEPFAKRKAAIKEYMKQTEGVSV